MRNRIPPPILTVMCIGLLWVFKTSLPILQFRWGWTIYVARVTIAVGLSLLLWSGVLFKHKKTTVNPFKPNNSKTIVSSGPYRFSRNPMYLGMLLVIFGVGLYLETLALVPVCLAFIVYMNAAQIKHEEQALTTLFGDDFTSYMGQVRRWI